MTDQITKTSDEALQAPDIDVENQPITLAATDEDSKIPRSVFFIIGNEFCERFSFYGMKAILWTYLVSFLLFKEEDATTVYHTFVMMAYVFSLLGAVIADTYWGKFKTIVYFSIIYCIGNIILSVTSFPGVTGNPPHWWGMALGLSLLALGTGGIKPCVSSFGGDQFAPEQVTARTYFFNMFYFSINAGSLLSMGITPNLRENVQCFGQKDCFPLAFGLPAVLLIVATIIFISGASLYQKRPVGENVLFKCVGAIFTAIKERKKAIKIPGHVELEHWIFYAQSKYSLNVLQDIKDVLAVLVILLPVSFFWMIYDQQGSRWTAQAWLMEHKLNVFGSVITIPPETMQIWNALFILGSIPICEKYVYPFFKRIGYEMHPLRRISVGLIIAGVSFLMSAALQYVIDFGTFETIGNQRLCQANCVPILWQVPQYIILTFGEVMVSITGLEFAYSQAPDSMKSLCQSVWLITVAIGNFLVIFFNLINPVGRLVTVHVEMWDSIMYTGVFALSVVGFIILAKRYRYVGALAHLSEHQYSVVPVRDEDE